MKNRVLTIFTFFIFHYSLVAQCAMCKAGAEQSLERGASDAMWLNYGILLLMCCPLIMVGVIYLLYKRNEKARKANSAEDQ